MELSGSSKKEKILLFCRRMGLDYGELDMLRDREDGRLYIVDVNNTPFGPPHGLPKAHAADAVRTLAENFAVLSAA